ncbi:hypothetical protein [Phenylobacterium sp.]|uniref:hypothetical protein n=1 Tax=Phenylobacterium sp. TaxID=1871053 RepID=UPI002E361967|nr:hypothetical protein [Phenylobacterium sp.]HEX3365475.1 hypothetical protein [Phenylobacterium sp.]
MTEDETLAQQFEALGEVQVRWHIAHKRFGDPNGWKQRAAEEWVRQKDAERAAELQAVELQVQTRAADAAERSAKAAELAAASAREAAEASKASNNLAEEANGIARDANTTALASNSLATGANHLARAANDNTRYAWIAAAASAVLALLSLVFKH